MPWLAALIGPDQGSPTTLQFCARAVLLLVYGVICIRIAGRRTFSKLSPLDIFIAIVVGSNISRVMTGGVPVIPSLTATLLLVVLHRLLAMATQRFNWLALFVKGRPSVLVRDGVMNRAAMRANDISKDDLIEGLRIGGIERVEDAALVTFERGGKISVLPRKQG